MSPATPGNNILFLYGTALVPAPILESAEDSLPPGYALTLCNSDVSDETRLERLSSADYVMLYGAGFDAETAPHVRLLQLLSAGYDRLDLDTLAEAGIPVANNGGANAQTVAEHTVLLILAVLKRLPLHHNALVDGEWLGLSQGLNLRELCDKQVGIIGFGQIGRRVARMVSAFGARPVYADVQDVDPADESGARRFALDELLATSDIVTLHTPLTDATRGLIGAKALASMRPDAIVINTSRGDVIDEAALTDAVANGAIAGAGLDVFAREPLGEDNALLGLSRTMNNVVLTPHVAGTTRDTWSRRLAFAYDNIQRVAAGNPPMSQVR